MNTFYAVGLIGIGAALTSFLLPQDDPLQAVYDLYNEECEGFDVEAASPVEEQAFFREWHDRLAVVAEQSEGDDSLKRSVYAEMTTLAVAVGDTPAAIAAAERRAALPGTAAERTEDAVRLAGVHWSSLGQNPTPARLAEVAAVQDATLALYRSVPAEERQGSLGPFGAQAIWQAADVQARLDRHGNAAEHLSFAAAEIDRYLPEGTPARTLLGVLGDKNFLLSRRGVEEAAAGDAVAALRDGDGTHGGRRGSEVARRVQNCFGSRTGRSGGRLPADLARGKPRRRFYAEDENRAGVRAGRGRAGRGSPRIAAGPAGESRRRARSPEG